MLLISAPRRIDAAKEQCVPLGCYTMRAATYSSQYKQQQQEEQQI
jgi:hypothetical protein